MSGLALVVGRPTAADESLLRRMLAAVPHRGDQVTVARCGQVALGVCRRVDAETASLAANDGLLAAVSGTFDNAGEPDLAALPVPDGVRSGAALLLSAYQRWGEDAIARLRGSFAGAVTDGSVVLVFRDHFGCRPLYHHEGGAGWFAATEVKQLVAGAGLARETDTDHLQRVLYGGVQHSTAVRGVLRVPRGSLGFARADGHAPGFRRYWEPERCVESLKSITCEEAREGLLAALDRATTRMRRGDDVILLSGGLDSPAIAASAVQAPSSGSMRALTATYPDYPSVDERGWAELVAAHLGLPLHTYVATAAAMDDIELWTARLDGPVDVLSIPECAEAYTAARELGARTVLNGEIAEYLLDARSALLGHLLYRGRWGALAQQARLRHERGRPWRRIARETARDAMPVGVLAWYYRRQGRWEARLPPWLDVRRATEVWEHVSMRPWDRWSRMQTIAFTGSGLQMEADEITAAYCGVDTRRPFTDVDLWEFVLALPAEVKLADARPKELLRQALRGRLPDAHLDRRDKTFFDEFHHATADYPALKGLLSSPTQRLPGVEYGVLQQRLEHGGLPMAELRWARELARIHAFLAGS